MDVATYEKVTDLCGRLGGRLSDPVLEALRVNYFVGELDLADATLLLGLTGEAVAITPPELEPLRAVGKRSAGRDLALCRPDGP